MVATPGNDKRKSLSESLRLSERQTPTTPGSSTAAQRPLSDAFTTPPRQTRCQNSLSPGGVPNQSWRGTPDVPYTPCTPAEKGSVPDSGSPCSLSGIPMSLRIELSPSESIRTASSVGDTADRHNPRPNDQPDANRPNPFRHLYSAADSPVQIWGISTCPYCLHIDPAHAPSGTVDSIITNYKNRIPPVLFKAIVKLRVPHDPVYIARRVIAKACAASPPLIPQLAKFSRSYSASQAWQFVYNHFGVDQFLRWDSEARAEVDAIRLQAVKDAAMDNEVQACHDAQDCLERVFTELKQIWCSDEGESCGLCDGAWDGVQLLELGCEGAWADMMEMERRNRL